MSWYQSDMIYTEPEPYVPPMWSTGTDEEIATALQKHYNDEIDLTEYWSVGDKRIIHLNAMSATGVSESHHADDYEFVIIGMNHDDLTTPINGHTKAIITVQMDRILHIDTTGDYFPDSSYNVYYEFGYINSNGSTKNWRDCARRTWCNNVFYSALPSTIQSLVKTVNKKGLQQPSTFSTYTTEDKAFLLALKEVYSVGANYEGSTYEYYNGTMSNLCKKPIYGYSYSDYISINWWLRTPYSFTSWSSSYAFNYVPSDSFSNLGSTNAPVTSCFGISPAFCM